MKIVKLNEDTIKDILDNLLKRSPNNYKEQEQIVNDSLGNIRERVIPRFSNIRRISTKWRSQPKQ